MKKKIVDWEALKVKVEEARQGGKKTVFTNGCFDLIHAGHVRYLREAKSLGDMLVVALNSDRSVSSIKPGRPIVPEAQRAEVLAALEMVDYITIFDQDTPYDIISLIRPDVLVKGGDWEKEDIVGSDIVPETHSLPYVEGISTTSIMERIRGLKA
jgi:rfaE bifunctional protein nucleotidyltransferase chain/domain